jgi:hypothetical protein
MMILSLSWFSIWSIKWIWMIKWSIFLSSKTSDGDSWIQSSTFFLYNLYHKQIQILEYISIEITFPMEDVSSLMWKKVTKWNNSPFRIFHQSPTNKKIFFELIKKCQHQFSFLLFALITTIVFCFNLVLYYEHCFFFKKENLLYVKKIISMPNSWIFSWD